MITTEVLMEAVREAKETAQSAVQRVSEYADSIHKGSTENIGINAGAVDDLGQAISDLSDTVDDLAATVSSLDERITALEGGKK